MTTLHDRSFLVIGATGALGSRVSRLLADEGAVLTLQGRDPHRLADLATLGTTIAGDLREPQTASTAVEAAVAAHGHLDGVVIASGAVAFGPVGSLPEDALLDLFRVNALAPIRVVQHALPHLTQSAAEGRSPVVLIISAVVAEQPTAGMAAYSASKSALTAFDAAAARELRRSGIRLIDARPPHTETGLAERPLTGTAPRLPQGLDPDDVAHRLVTAIVDGETDLPSSAFSRGPDPKAR